MVAFRLDMYSVRHGIGLGPRQKIAEKKKKKKRRRETSRRRGPGSRVAKSFFFFPLPSGHSL